VSWRMRAATAAEGGAWRLAHALLCGGRHVRNAAGSLHIEYAFVQWSEGVPSVAVHTARHEASHSSL
jgi:hypothetical protein